MDIYGKLLKFCLQSFDISTTVDPSHVISMIRKLLPSDVQDCEHSMEMASIREDPNTEGRKEDESYVNFGTFDRPESSNVDRNEGRSAIEETWEECGCILWDLAASEDHAQLMVFAILILCFWPSFVCFSIPSFHFLHIEMVQIPKSKKIRAHHLNI